MRKPFDYFDNSYKCVPYWDATDSEKRIVRGIISGKYSTNLWHWVVGEIDNKSLEWHMWPGDFYNLPFWFDIKDKPLVKVPPFVIVPMVESGINELEEQQVRLIFEWHIMGEDDSTNR